MAIVTVIYRGTTSSGKYHKYEVEATPGSGNKPANNHSNDLTNEGVQLNANLGYIGFLSQTHLYLTSKIGDKTKVDVRGFSKNPTTTINYFHNIDKEKQEAFSKIQKMNKEFAEISSFTKKLEEFDISANDYKSFEEIKLLKEKRRLVAAQLKGLSDEE